MNGLWAEVFMGLGDEEKVVRSLARLTVAAAMGAILGYERQTERKPTDARMHMIVAMGAALVTLVVSESGNADAVSRAVQGIITGVGFLGAGAIIKDDSEHKIHGLTTASSVWLTAAIGIAIGAGHLWPAVFAVLLGWIFLAGLKKIQFPRGDFLPPPEKKKDI
jgi:putative Mg2+ transporter-C (MgtC) family protein